MHFMPARVGLNLKSSYNTTNLNWHELINKLDILDNNYT
jgi:hypothetical protein